MERIKRVNEVFLITVALSVVASFVLGAIPALQDNELASLLFSQLVYAVPVLIYLLKTRENPKTALRFQGLKPVTVILLVVFAYLITPVLNVLNAVSMLFSTNMINNSLMGIITEYPLWVGIASVALVPAILEESVYRGVFFNEYRKKNPKLGILISGLLFGLMHMNINQFSYAFVMGIIFAILVEATDSLFASMVVHFVINATSVLASAFVGEAVMVQTKGELISYLYTMLPIAVVFTGLAIAILFLIAKLEKKREVLKTLFSAENKKRETIITLPLVLGIVICVFLMVYMEIVNRLTL